KMRIRLAYHRDGLYVDIPDRNLVAVPEPRETEPESDGATLVARALAEPIGTPPLSELARTKRSAVVAVCDVTRPVPNPIILPQVLRSLEESGIPRRAITILVATGLHRPDSIDELKEMLGPEIVAHYRVENHVATDPDSHVDLGVTPRGVPVHIDRRWCESDLKISIGLIEPHFMAGWSGGRKLICPGLASEETIRRWHSPIFLEHPAATVGSIVGNPVHEENTWIARRAGCDFIVNVVIDRARRIQRAVAGDLEQAWERGVASASEQMTVTIPEPVDIVVTSAAGYPLDATYYQAIKGVVCASESVKPGGTIICAAGMREGLGSDAFVRCFADYPDPDDFLRAILPDSAPVRTDQWQIEEYVKALRRARCIFVTDGQPHAVLRRMYAKTSDSVESAIRESLERYGHMATIAVIPEGPYVLVKVANR
ncbi:MAG: nickel-dependent lactate racemase, partial [Planctomycetia bacterium]|nr:nickel-dependent lactate racemase [Planctomycetia bacterium]